MQIQFDPLDPLALLCMHTNYGAKGSKGSNYTLLSGSRPAFLGLVQPGDRFVVCEREIGSGGRDRKECVT